MLSFTVLSSGSSGNAVYIRSNTTRILLDAGISGKQLQQRMNSVAEDSLEQLDGLLITHEHIDHVRGLKQVAKQSKAMMFGTEGTWHQVRKDLPEDCAPDRVGIVRANERFTIGDVEVTPFTVSHDAEEPVAYRFDSGENSLAVVTDLGYVSDFIKSVIVDCQCYVFESNHDVNMLRAGRYPWALKRRILGDKGHLSNEDAAYALGELVAERPVDVYLAHLSEENNQPDLAELTVSSILQEIKSTYQEQVRLHRTSRHFATALHTL